jgi:hypothetical protein
MISPHRSNRRKLKTQDGRRLRRYERRWLVERSLRGCNGNVGSWCAGNSMLEISWALSNLHPFLSC